MTDGTALKEKTKRTGHEAHSEASENQRGLPGKFHRRIKIAYIGGGSGFCPRLCNDILKIPGADGGEIVLVDIDKERLSTMHELVGRLIEKTGQSGAWSVSATMDRREALPGADYVVNSIEVSGMDCVKFDYDIPFKYGVDQCIGDTLGPGGLFKGLRTIPVYIDILKDCEDLCPEAIVGNYTNPMNMICLAAGKASSMRTVGLCHSVQSTSRILAGYAEVPYEEMEWECAGINHLAWFTKLRHKGADLYPRLYEKFHKEIEAGIREAEEGNARHDDLDASIKGQAAAEYKYTDLIRKDMCVQFGAFVTESSGHFSEYLPYYRKSEAGGRLLRLGYDGGSRFYATNWPTWRRNQDEKRQAMLKGEDSMDWKRSWEYASWIIEAKEKDVPFRIYGNVMNNHRGAGPLIGNLLADGSVEVACMVDRNGVNPTAFGNLPPQMAAICRSSQAVCELGAIAGIERSKEAAIHALMLDPLTAAVCTPSEIRAMALEMFEAEKAYLPGYK